MSNVIYNISKKVYRCDQSEVDELVTWNNCDMHCGWIEVKGWGWRSLLSWLVITFSFLQRLQGLPHVVGAQDVSSWPVPLSTLIWSMLMSFSKLMSDLCIGCSGVMRGVRCGDSLWYPLTTIPHQYNAKLPISHNTHLITTWPWTLQNQSAWKWSFY